MYFTEHHHLDRKFYNQCKKKAYVKTALQACTSSLSSKSWTCSSNVLNVLIKTFSWFIVVIPYPRSCWSLERFSVYVAEAAASSRSSPYITQKFTKHYLSFYFFWFLYENNSRKNNKAIRTILCVSGNSVNTILMLCFFGLCFIILWKLYYSWQFFKNSSTLLKALFNVSLMFHFFLLRFISAARAIE